MSREMLLHGAASLSSFGETSQVDFVDMTALFDGETVETVDDRKDYGETRLNCGGEVEGRGRASPR